MIFRRLISLALAAFMAIAPVDFARASQGSLLMPTTGTVSGLTLVTDINAALDALVTCNSGSSAPANALVAPSMGQFWCDNTTATAIKMKVYDGTNWLVVAVLDATNHVWTPVVGGGTATIASAGTTDLWSSPQASITISGTTTITQLANASAVPGTIKLVKFSGILTLTQDATKLILPTAASITTAAGDYAIVVALTSTNVAVMYFRADGTAVSASANFTGAVSYTADISPTSFSTQQNNYAPTGFATAARVRLNATSPVFFTGLAGGASGREVILSNVSTNDSYILITPNDAASSAGNRFLFNQALQLLPGQSVLVRYDSTSSGWRSATYQVTPPPAGTFAQLTLANNAGTPNNKVDIAYASLVLLRANDSFDTMSVINGSLTADVTASGANGLDTGSVAASTWYAVYVIGTPGLGFAALLSTNFTAPTMPAGYSYFARVGAFVTDASNHFMRIKCLGRICQYVVTASTNTPILPSLIAGTIGTFSLTTPTYSQRFLSTLVPPSTSKIGFVATNTWQGNAAGSTIVAPNGNYSGPQSAAGNIPVAWLNNAFGMTIEGWVLNEFGSSVQLWVASSGAGANISILGWEDNL